MAVATALSPAQARDVIAWFTAEFVAGSSDIYRARLVRVDGDVELRVTVDAECRTDLPERFSNYGIPVRTEIGRPGVALTTAAA